MAAHRVGIIGTGDPATRSPKGYAMAYSHAPAYHAQAERCRIVACADLVQERADAFAQEFGVEHTYLDYHQMLARENLDVVSICTWPHLHEQMVVDCSEAGVHAIHCEKPMATTWGACKHAVEVCRQKGVQLTYNHQRRFGRPFRTAKQLLDEGAIGELECIEFGMFNLCDYGSHSFDMSAYFADQTPVEWVLAQVAYDRESLFFDMPNDTQAVAVWRYANGVLGRCATGPAGMSLPVHNRLVGTDGVIEVGRRGEGMPVLRVRRKGGAEWEAMDCGDESCHGPNLHERAIAHVLDCLESGEKPELCGENALQSTELIFACWESSRRRGPVDLPLDVDDNALVAMIEAGEIGPRPGA